MAYPINDKYEEVKTPRELIILLNEGTPIYYGYWEIFNEETECYDRYSDRPKKREIKNLSLHKDLLLEDECAAWEPTWKLQRVDGVLISSILDCVFFKRKHNIVGRFYCSSLEDANRAKSLIDSRTCVRSGSFLSDKLCFVREADGKYFVEYE